MDDDCDGKVDESCQKPCKAGSRRSCYGGPKGTAGKGICKVGSQVCLSYGAWGPCRGQVLPRLEVCNKVDDDCDGKVDEGNVCPPASCKNYPAYPTAIAAQVLHKNVGVCYLEGSLFGYAWGYAMDGGVVNLSWRALEKKTPIQIAQVIANYLDSRVKKATMLVISLGARFGGQKNYPAAAESKAKEKFLPVWAQNLIKKNTSKQRYIAGYIFNPDSVWASTPILESPLFQRDVEPFLKNFGLGLKLALCRADRRRKVLAVVVWLGSYSKSHYAGIPGNYRVPIWSAYANKVEVGIKPLLEKYVRYIGLVAQIPLLVRIEVARWVDPKTKKPFGWSGAFARSALLKREILRAHIWFANNGWRTCDQEVKTNSQCWRAFRYQAQTLLSLRCYGSAANKCVKPVTNVGWEAAFFSKPPSRKVPDIDSAVVIGKFARPTFSCAQLKYHKSPYLYQNKSYAEHMKRMFDKVWINPVKW